ncbi:MAG: CidA/LrgA family protein [Flavonifractor plautii]
MGENQNEYHGTTGPYFGLSLVGEGVAALLPVSFPSSVISMMLLMALLLTGVIKDKHIKTVSTLSGGQYGASSLFHRLLALWSTGRC